MLLFLPGLVLSCVSGPEPVSTAAPTAQPSSVPAAQTETAEPVTQEAPSQERGFDPNSISEEVFAAAKFDIQHLIESLNGIIRARNYNAWRTYLSDSYFEEISSPAFLEERTEELYKRDQMVASNLGRDPRRVQKKVLRTAKDYFDNVVVPSRSNDHMDDIAFVSENRVKAYTVDNRGSRLVLYDLEIIDNKWKIIN